MKKSLLLTVILCLLLMCSTGVAADAAAYDWSVSRDCSYDVYVTAVDGVNLRNEPVVEAPLMTNIPTFVCLHITMESTAGWGYTTYNGMSGWVALSETGSSYPTTAANQSVEVAASDGGCNFRSGPHASYATLTAMIPNGTVLTITATTANNWGYTAYNGLSGWIALSQTKTATAEEPQQPAATPETQEKPQASEATDAATTVNDKESDNNSNLITLLIIAMVILCLVIAALCVLLILRKKKDEPKA